MKKEDMFYMSGQINGHDGRCRNCPFSVFVDGSMVCKETEQNVDLYDKFDRINRNCPFITK